jgi:hypothetical protein
MVSGFKRSSRRQIDSTFTASVCACSHRIREYSSMILLVLSSLS